MRRCNECSKTETCRFYEFYGAMSNRAETCTDFEEKIKPCPFCGGNDIHVIRFNEGWGCICQNKACNCRVGIVFGDDKTCTQTREEAIKTWNKRI